MCARRRHPGHFKARDVCRPIERRRVLRPVVDPAWNAQHGFGPPAVPTRVTREFVRASLRNDWEFASHRRCSSASGTSHCRPADGRRLSRGMAGRRKDAGREKCPRNVVGDVPLDGRRPARRVSHTVRSPQTENVSRAQARSCIMRPLNHGQIGNVGQREGDTLWVRKNPSRFSSPSTAF
jgi:hypothetical protein